MPALDWEVFAQLPGSSETNFESLCRHLVRRNYGQFGAFAAVSAQPGVEFHLTLHAKCSLGEPGRWWGWQCRWYDHPGGRAIGAPRRRKIIEAIEKTERYLPGLTDWVLWTRRPLTIGDQNWFSSLKTRMRLHQWTAAEIEEHLTGEAAVFRGTYFGDLVLTPILLERIHEKSIAAIKRRWHPEVHQVIDAERVLRQMLGEPTSWEHLRRLALQIDNEMAFIAIDQTDLDASSMNDVNRILDVGRTFSAGLQSISEALDSGNLDQLRQRIEDSSLLPGIELRLLLRRLRNRRCRQALFVTNAIADMYLASQVVFSLSEMVGTQIVSVLADAGCGKTQLAVELTSTCNGRPAGILLHGRDLQAGQSLDDIARKVVISGVPIPSMDALLASVEAAGQRAGCRLPIVIDGLNEAEDPRNWFDLLSALYAGLSQYSYTLVVCTIRGAFAKEALPAEIKQLEIEDFGFDADAAIARYFEYYRINAADADLPISLLRHPLTLKLFCEVTNPKRDKVVGIEAMPGSLTALFDKYLEQAAERISQLSKPPRRIYDQEVRSAFDEIGITLWESGKRSVGVQDLRIRLNEGGKPWAESLVRYLEEEGVLLRFPGTSPEVAVVYDALAGHLVGNAILTKHGRNGFDRWLRSTKTKKLLDRSSPKSHHLASDIFYSLVGLIPRRLHSVQLWTLVDEPLRALALRAAANLEGTYLDAETVREISHLVVGTTSCTPDIFHRLLQTRGSENHPLNADYLDSVLRRMTLCQRDLRWTEWIRRNQDRILSDLNALESRWKGNLKPKGRSEFLRCRWVLWVLTSTVARVRDKATRTLYWFGWGNPQELFRLTIDSLKLNDPYVIERTLAASYGACMALHSRPKRPLFRSNILPEFAKRLYKRVFAIGAPSSTTHVLSRDYARRIIEIAMLHNPGILTTYERCLIMPPYRYGGIREWKTLKDPNEQKYRNGNSPLGMDFANYSIGSLVPDRNPYQFEHKGYQEVRDQIVWRLYELGYSLEAFSAIDSEIANQRYYGRHERPHVERYGKKYARIAYLELFGFREDNGLMKGSFYDQKRAAEIDIDPSFPNGPCKLRLIEDILGDRTATVKTWVEQGPTPSFQPYLLAQRCGDVEGPWILIDTFCSQEDRIEERSGFVRIQSVLVLNDDLEEFVSLSSSMAAKGKWLPDPEEDHHVFAGEMPWCDTFPQDLLRTVDFEVGRKKRKISSNNPFPRIVFNIGGKKLTIPPHRSSFEEVPIYKSIPVFIPVRQNDFSSNGHTKRPRAVVPAKWLMEYGRLRIDLPSWNMVDPQGQTCSISTATNNLVDSEHHLFLRKELIDKLLESQSLSLIWVVWGERLHFSTRRFIDDRHSAGFKYFQQVYRYADGEAVPCN